MRERSLWLDIATLLLLLVIAVFNGIVLLQNNNIEKQLMSMRGLGNSGGGRASHDANSASGARKPAGTFQVSTTDIVPVTGKLYDNSSVPKFKTGDEEAEDGDTLVIREPNEPNSMNYLVDNDAFLGQMDEKVLNDRLALRTYDDLKTWQGHLARAWEKSMICRGLARDKNAPELAKKLEAGLDEAARKRLGITKISTESDEVLRIDLGDVKGDYRDEAAKLLGAGAIEKQTWIYVSYETGTFTNGEEVNSTTVASRLQKAISAQGFKGRFLQAWERESSVVIKVVGGAEAAEKALKDYIASPENSADLIDPKAASGKRRDKALSYDITEIYDFEENPVFTFHLRKDVRWHDGAPFTGKDVVWSFQTVSNKLIEAGPSRQQVVDCGSVSLVNNDPYVVQFVWKKPYALSFARSCELVIQPEHHRKFKDAKDFNQGEKNQSFIGLGPYKFVNWERKVSMTLERNDDFYGPRPHFKKILIKFVNDNTVALQMQRAGDLDFNDLIQPPQMKEIEKDPAFLKTNVADVSGQLVYTYLGWNIRRELFSSVKVRRALTMLIDRQRAIEDAMRGYAIPMYGPCHPESPIFTDAIKKYEYKFNPAEAKKMLAEDGWKDTNGDGVIDKNGKAFKFNLIIRNGDTVGLSVANMIKQSLEDAGIVMSIDVVEWSILLQRVERHEFDCVRLAWRMTLDDDPYQLWHSSQCIEKASNHCGYKNAEVDSLIEAGRRELVDERRVELFRKVYEIIASEQPYTFMYTPKRLVGYSRRIKNAVFKIVEPEYVRWWVPRDAQRDPE